jgi:hypothetical protein
MQTSPTTGKLSIQLAYAERGTYSYIGSTVIGSSFSIHGIVDQLDPVVESAVCIGQNPPPVPGTLTFLGRYRLTSSAPAGFPSTCPTRETKTTPLCRFEVRVQDNDQVARPMWHAGGTAGEASGSDLPTAAIARVQGEAPSPTTTCLVGKPGGLAAGVAGDSNFGHASCEGLVTAGPGRRA